MSQIITLQYNDFSVLFQDNASINATAIAKQFGKIPKDYLRLERTKDYIEAVRRNRLTEQNQLVTVVQGGLPEEQGTWIHKFLAIDFARWLNADFAVWCDMQIEKILENNKIPYGLQQRLDEINCPVYLTPTMRRDIKTMVRESSIKSGVHWQSIYIQLNNMFGGSDIHTIEVTKYPDICVHFGKTPTLGIPSYMLCNGAEYKTLRDAKIELDIMKGGASKYFVMVEKVELDRLTAELEATNTKLLEQDKAPDWAEKLIESSCERQAAHNARAQLQMECEVDKLHSNLKQSRKALDDAMKLLEEYHTQTPIIKGFEKQFSA